jgi:hypothetical protein
MSSTPALPRELEILREHGILPRTPLEEATTRDLLEVEEEEGDGDRETVLALVLCNVALWGPGPGPDGWVACYSDRDELAELGEDVTDALGPASRLRVETRWDRDEVLLALEIDGERTVLRLREWYSGALATPISEALARAGDPRQLVEVACGWDAFVYLLAPRAAIAAIAQAGVTGFLTEPKPRKRTA